MRRREIIADIHPGFQIAPMIDIVFVIMLFFMVMSGAVKVERELKIALPKYTAGDTKYPDEIFIAIAEDGTVTMNDEEFDAPADKKLPRLTTSLIRLKEDADAHGTKDLITLQTEEQTRYERVIDVLNALARAGINNVTFTLGNETP